MPDTTPDLEFTLTIRLDASSGSLVSDLGIDQVLPFMLDGVSEAVREGRADAGIVRDVNGHTVGKWQTRDVVPDALVEYHTLAGTDIGRRSIHAFGRDWNTVDHIGIVMPRDVGKRIYYRGGNRITIESTPDYHARINASN